MKHARTRLSLVLLGASLTAAACETAKSANPLSPDVAGPIPGVTITAPKPLEPTNGQQLVSDGTAQTLLIENAGSTGPRPLHLQIQVATDGGFQQLVHHAERVTPGENGRTTYRLPEPLGPGRTYYWRARALDGANTGPYSGAAHFGVIEPVRIDTPLPLEPQGNISTNRPNFVVRNGQVSGPAGDVIYRFEIGTSASAPPAAVISATPGSGGTTTISLGDLPWDRTLFWRVYATDGATNSAYSGIVSFKTPAPGVSAAPLPGGSGGRTPDPPPGQRLPLPDMFHVVQQVAAARPDLLRNSCQDHGGSWGFMDLLVDTLRTYDTRWGYNWKRGRVGDASHDVVDYHWGRGPSEGSSEVYIIDVIVGHCGTNPGPNWLDVTDVTYSSGTIGRWTGRGRF